MTEVRDIQIGAVLRDLGRPEHGKDFFPRLFEVMDAESALSVGESLVPELAPKGHKRWFARRPIILATAAAAAVVALVTLVGLPREGSNPVVGPRPATAAERMLAKMTWAMSTARNVQGVATVVDRQYEASFEESFAVDDKGDYRLETRDRTPNPRSPGLLVYNAEQRIILARRPGDPDTLVRTNAWPPIAPFPLYADISDGWGFFSFQNFAATVKALLAERLDTVKVDETVVDGRPVWKATLPILGLRAPQSDAGAAKRAVVATVTVTVDRETGFLLRYVRRPGAGTSITLSDGTRWYGLGPLRVVVTDLQVDAELPASLFDVESSQAQPGISTFADVPDLARDTGLPPLLPTWLPDGFTLAESSSFEWYSAAPPGPTVLPWVSWSGLRMGGQGPLGFYGPLEETPVPRSLTPEIDLLYRRGLDWVIVRQMKTGAVTPDSTMGRPVMKYEISDPAFKWGYRRGVLSSGALKGEPVFSWLADATATSGSGPISTGCTAFMWGRSPDATSVLVTGTLTRRELIQIAESLQPLPQ